MNENSLLEYFNYVVRQADMARTHSPEHDQVFSYYCFYKDKNHHIIVSYAYGSDDGYYWDKQYFLIIDNKPYIFLVIGSYSGWIEKNNSLKQVDFDYLKNRKKENTSNLYNDISVSDFDVDRCTFENLYAFMLDNNAKEVLENDNGFKVIE